MTPDTFRQFALGLPETEEKSHFGKADFRVRNKIFATLPGDGTGVVKLRPAEQEIMTSSESAIFQPVKGGWGRQGWTRVNLDAADEDALRSALTVAWRNMAPKSLLGHLPAEDTLKR